MKRGWIGGTLAVAVVALGALAIAPTVGCGQDTPFGSPADVDFAHALWEGMNGYDNWLLTTDVYPGASPHGMFLRMYYNVITIGGEPYHVIVKDNFGGKDLTMEMVKANQADHLAAVTVMVQREAGYDPDNNDWFWVKFGSDGVIDKTEDGAMLAGRVAKGMNMGCIACHVNAGGGDYLFTNDEAPASE